MLDYASGENKVDYLFNVQKIFGLEVDSRALDWALLIQHPTVADIGPHSKCHRFVLGNLITRAMRETRTSLGGRQAEASDEKPLARHTHFSTP